MIKQYLDKSGLTYFWGKVKDNMPIKKLPLVYSYDEEEQEGAYYNNVINTENEPGTGISSGVYIVDTSICTETYSYLQLWFGHGTSKNYKTYDLKHGDIIIATHASDSIYSVNDQLTVIQNGNISRVLVTAVGVQSNPKTTLSITNTVTEQIHHFSDSSYNAYVFRNHDIYTNDVDFTATCSGLGTVQDITFPAGTLFFNTVYNSTSSSKPGLIITPTGDMYKVTSITTMINLNKISLGGFDYTTVTGYSQSTANQFLTHDTSGNLMWVTGTTASNISVDPSDTSDKNIWIETNNS